MGIYGALATAVTGLKAQSFALENISGNIANSQTTGYKRMETRFVDLIPDAATSRQVPGAVLASSRSTNTVKGDIVGVDEDTYIAMSGQGFFVVDKPVDYSDGVPSFSGSDFFTRRGDFDLDKNGYLVNGAGYMLKGLKIDQATGNTFGSVPQVVQITNSFLAPVATTEVSYSINLPETPKTTASANSTAPNSELLAYGAFAVDPRPVPTGTGVIQAANAGSFIDGSVDGGSITVYTVSGSPVDVQLRWAKIDSVANGGADTWNLFYLKDSEATTTTTAWENVGQSYVFGTDNKLSPAVPTVALTGMEVNGVNVNGFNLLNHGTNGVTQYASLDGKSQVTKLTQNGFAAGEYDGVAIANNGRIVVSYTNGQLVEVAEVSVANFNAANQLKRLDGGIFSATSESGEAIYGTADIIASALESSNTDISEEFTKLIVTQQAYAAGTRIVASADEMLQEALNMVR